MSGSKYEDIIHLPHHVSEKRPSMPMADRAAQFAPFAALTGYDAAIKETARVTDKERDLDEDEKRLIDEKIRKAIECPDKKIWIEFFKADTKKRGGEYIWVCGYIKKYDAFFRTLELDDGIKISIDSISDMH